MDANATNTSFTNKICACQLSFGGILVVPQRCVKMVFVIDFKFRKFLEPKLQKRLIFPVQITTQRENSCFLFTQFLFFEFSREFKHESLY